MTEIKQVDSRTLRQLLGRDASILSLAGFLQKHVPSLPPLPAECATQTSGHADTMYLLQKIIVSPFRTMPCLDNVYGKRGAAINCESLSSVVDHAVWSLVTRRERERRRHRQNASHNKSLELEDTRNILCQGFVVASDELIRLGAQSMRSMPPGILLMQINHNVEYLKSTPLFALLHRWVGDSVLRALLLHCRIFVPILNSDSVPSGLRAHYRSDNGGDGDDDDDHAENLWRENYLQITGPPLRLVKIDNTFKSNSNKANETKCRKRKRRHRSIKNASKSIPHSVPCPELAPTATLRKNPLLYSNAHVPRAGLPTHHVLNDEPKEKEKHANLLLGNIFALGSGKQLQRKRWQRLRHRGVDLCDGILANHHKCDYHRLLDRYCPIPKQLAQDNATREEVDFSFLAISFTPSTAVASFVKAVLKRVFGVPVWGSSHNQDCIMQLVDGFVKARRHEHFPNHQLLQGLRISCMAWLYKAPSAKVSRSDQKATQDLALRLIRWTFENVVTPLLSSCFHVTDAEFAGKCLVYYRKQVWVLFRSLSMRKLLKQQYQEISSSEAAARLDTQAIGLSMLRLMPKKTGVRPIAMLSKPAHISLDKNTVQEKMVFPRDDSNQEQQDHEQPSKRRKCEDSAPGHSAIQRKWTPSTNVLLTEAFAALRFEYGRDPSLFGSGLDGLHHFYPRYRAFIQRVQSRSSQSRGDPVRLVFGSVDIKHCFDSIQQDELLKIVGSILKLDDYVIQNFSQYRPFQSISRLLRLKKNHVCSPEEMGPFHQVVSHLAKSSHQTVYADTGGSTVAKTEQLLDLIKAHLKGHLVVTADRRRGSRYLLQSTGVPQGSSLSTLLCNFYYGNLESKLLQSLDDESRNQHRDHYLVVRQVDDFLFVGTRKKLLEEFIKAMLRGDQALGVEVNEDKTQVSTTVVLHRGNTCERITPASSRRYFSWCGMLFDVSTGEVRIDYSRFHDGKAANSISIDRSRGQGEEMMLQLKSFVRPRCIPILFDKHLNSFAVQQINLYQLMVFAAVKLVLYIRTRGILIDRNESYISQSITFTISYAEALIHSRLGAAEASWDMTPSRHQHLCWRAFRDVFRRYGNDFKTILSTIDGTLTEFSDHDVVQQTCRCALRSMNLGKLLLTDKAG